MFPEARRQGAAALAFGLAASASPLIVRDGSGPCDIYGDAGTPCVAAHSTTRALYSAYDGPLYKAKRASDGTEVTISPSAAGGVADSAPQDSFCANTSCTITIIYDQSGRGNHLTAAPPGGAASGQGLYGYDELADATAAPATLGGKKVYGVYIQPGMGYRNDDTNGVATGDEPESLYAVLDGTVSNGACCFDYGNAETNNHDDGDATMEAIYFGTNSYWGSGEGSGPWIMADLENGLFSGSYPKENNADPTITDRFVHAVVKGESNHWSIRGGDATAGQLSTFFDGVRPDGYNPMKKQGAIILGIGGDNSNGATGIFYEGVMTSGYASDGTENAVAANIAAAGYST